MPEVQSFVVDMEELRRRAREHLEEGPVTGNYEGEVATTVKLLNDALATELVCVLRYKFHAVTAQGIHSESGRRGSSPPRPTRRRSTPTLIAERINQLGGKPDFDPAGLLTRSATQYVEGQDLRGMIEEDLVAERIAVETYRAMVRHFANHDPTTRQMLEGILAKEEEHANDMHDLLVQQRGA